MIYIIVIILILLLIWFLMGGILFNFALNPKKIEKNKKKQNKVAQVALDLKDNHQKDVDEFKKILDKNGVEKYLAAYDGTKLHAYMLETNKNNNKWIIGIHGYMNEAYSFGDFALRLYKEGYNLLLPDLRGCGKNEYKYVTMGWKDRKDIRKWAEVLSKEIPNSQIAIYGISMGAATAMMTSGEQLPSNVKCIIEDSGYTSVWDEFQYELKEHFKLPTFPFLYAASSVCKIKEGFRFGKASSIDSLKNNKLPILMIHGTGDTFVPYYMHAIEYNAVKTDGKEELIIKDAKHVEGKDIEPEKYYNTLFKFLNKYVK